MRKKRIIYMNGRTPLLPIRPLKPPMTLEDAWIPVERSRWHRGGYLLYGLNGDGHFTRPKLVCALGRHPPFRDGCVLAQWHNMQA